MLFNSTLRKNLDPFGEFNDDELWSVLENVYLADTARESPSGLDTGVKSHLTMKYKMLNIYIQKKLC